MITINYVISNQYHRKYQHHHISISRLVVARNNIFFVKCLHKPLGKRRNEKDDQYKRHKNRERERDCVLYQMPTNKMSTINILIVLTCLQSTGTYNTKHSVGCHEKKNTNHNRKITVLPYRIICKSMHLIVI